MFSVANSNERLALCQPNYEDRSLNTLQNDIISVSFQNMTIWKYTFCRKFNWGHILEFL